MAAYKPQRLNVDIPVLKGEKGDKGDPGEVNYTVINEYIDEKVGDKEAMISLSNAEIENILT